MITFYRFYIFSCLTLITCIITTSTPSLARYTASHGDTIEVSVFQYPEYSGQSIIDESGQITLPALGRIIVHNLSLRGMEQKISERLVKNFGHADYRVVAKIVALRPVSVLGAVARPGRYPYHTGMLVIDAIAAAGGRGTYVNDAYRMYVDHIRANSNLETLTSEYWSAMAKKARLEAELLNSNSVKFPLLLTRFEEQKRNDIFTKTENEIFRTRRLRLNNQTKLLEEQKNSLQSEVKEIKNHKDKLQRLMLYLENELENSNSLAKKGLTRRFTIISQEQQVSDMRIDYHRSIIALMRAQQKNVEVKNQLDGIQNDNRENLLVALKQSALQLEVLKNKLESQRKFVNQIFINNHGNYSKIEVLRTSLNGTVKKMVARTETAIKPGDVIIILKTTDSGASDFKETSHIN